MSAPKLPPEIETAIATAEALDDEQLEDVLFEMAATEVEAAFEARDHEVEEWLNRLQSPRSQRSGS